MADPPGSAPDPPPGETPEQALDRIAASLVAQYGAACWAVGGPRAGAPGATAFALRHPPGTPYAGVFLVVPRGHVSESTASISVPEGAASHGESRRLLLADAPKWFAPQPRDVAVALLSAGPWHADADRRGYEWTPPAFSFARHPDLGPWPGGPCFVLGRPRLDAPVEAHRALARVEDGQAVLTRTAPDGFAGAPVLALRDISEGQVVIEVVGAVAQATPLRTLLPAAAIAAAVERAA